MKHLVGSLRPRLGLSLGLFLLASLLLSACGGDNNALTLSTVSATTGAATSGTTTSAATSAATVASTTAATVVNAATTQAATTTRSIASLTPTAGGSTPTVAASAATSPASQANSNAVPRYEAATKCPFKLADGQTEGPNLKCGYLIVPELHANPTGKTIKLAVVTLKGSSSQPKNPPVIFLQGGPGGGSDDILQFFASQVIPTRNIIQDQDLILFDQRGVGHSEPALYCKELDDLAHTDLDKITPPDQATAKSVAATLKCRDRLVGQGVNLAAYNSAESASDVDDLRVALGLDKVDLYGVSYGTRLALTVMRDHPQGIRSVILDSTVALQTNGEVDVPVNADRAINELFKVCAANAACNRDYPNLKDTFSKTFAALKQKPAMVKVKDSVTKQSYNVAVDGNLLVSTIFQLLYSTEVITILPALLTTVQAGNYDLLAALLPDILFTDRDVALGMYFSVQCTEELPFEKPADVVANANAHNILPEVKEAFVVGSEGEFTICNQWPVKKAGPIENQAVKSDIPTLVLSGQLDPITPPAEGQEAASTLSKSFYVLFPGFGHGASLVSAPLGGQCSADIVRNFLSSPTTPPNTSCTSQLKLNFLAKANIDLLIQNIKQQDQSNP